jgi:hypothetical protein
VTPSPWLSLSVLKYQKNVHVLTKRFKALRGSVGQLSRSQFSRAVGPLDSTQLNFAEEVRCVGCCWMGTYNVVLYQAIDFSHTNKNAKHTDRAAAG